MSEARKKPTVKEQLAIAQEMLEKADESKKNMFIHFTNQIKDLESKLEIFREGTKEVQKSMDLILISLAKKYGDKKENGFELVIDKPATENLDKYKVIAFANEEEPDYHVCVRLKDAEVQE